MKYERVTVEVVFRARCGKHTVVTDIVGVDMTMYPDDPLSEFRHLQGRRLAMSAIAALNDRHERERIADRLMHAIADVSRRNEVDP